MSWLLLRAFFMRSFFAAKNKFKCRLFPMCRFFFFRKEIFSYTLKYILCEIFSCKIYFIAKLFSKLLVKFRRFFFLCVHYLLHRNRFEWYIDSIRGVYLKNHIRKYQFVRKNLKKARFPCNWEKYQNKNIHIDSDRTNKNRKTELKSLSESIFWNIFLPFMSGSLLERRGLFPSSLFMSK